MPDGPVLTTERLILRPPAMADFEAYADYVADPAAMDPIGGAQPRAVAWRTFMAYAGAWAMTGVSMFCVFEREGTAEGRYLGRIGPWFPADWPGPEVGWGLRVDAQGRGYAVEAASACMDFAFDRLGWSQAIHTIMPDNAASQRVAQRLGSAKLREAMLPAPHLKLTDVWGQTRVEWRARRR